MVERAASKPIEGTKIAYQARIVCDPQVCGGQPIIRGTRVSVRMILVYLAHGETFAAILRAFPSLTVEDIRTVIASIAAVITEETPSPAPFQPI